MIFSDEWKTKLEEGSEAQISAAFKALHLSGMAMAFQEQENMLSTFGEMPFCKRLGMICEKEIEQRENSALQKRLRDARLSNSSACMENFDERKSRKMNMELVYQLGSCSFIEDKRHVSIEGATGTGKTYLANALGNAACRAGYKVRNTRLADLLNEMVAARARGEADKVKNYYTKYDLLILDEWLMHPLGAGISFELLELIDSCCGKSSMIFCTQYPHSEWYGRIDIERPEGAGSTLAEAILDRIIHHMSVVTISTSESMRSFYDAKGENTNSKNK